MSLSQSVIYAKDRSLMLKLLLSFSGNWVLKTSVMPKMASKVAPGISIINELALEACKKENFDLCFMGIYTSISVLTGDLQMPSSVLGSGPNRCLLSGMDGLTATKVLMTEYPENQRPIVIAMTAKFLPLLTFRWTEHTDGF
jgi:CheY-like chemotaxis protein